MVLDALELNKIRKSLAADGAKWQDLLALLESCHELEVAKMIISVVAVNIHETVPGSEGESNCCMGDCTSQVLLKAISN